MTGTISESRTPSAKTHEGHLRSVVKGATWRFVGSCDTFMLTLIFSGQINLSFKISGAELATKIFLYYLHERAWLRVSWLKESTYVFPSPTLWLMRTLESWWDRFWPYVFKQIAPTPPLVLEEIRSRARIAAYEKEDSD